MSGADPNGECSKCQYSLRPDGTCQNPKCSEFVILDLSCDSCGAEIVPDELYWTDAKGSTLCEECIPPGAVSVGIKH